MNRSTRAYVQRQLDDESGLLQDVPDDDDGPSLASLARGLRNLVVARWRTLVLGTLIAPAVAAAILLPQPKTYVADALVVPTRTRTDVSFEPSIKTSSATDPTQTQPGVSTLTPEHRQALADLVTSGDLEAQVIQQLQGKVDPSLLQHGALAPHVKGVLMPKSEVIAVEVETTNPSDSVAIANAWVTNYVDLANRVYGGGDAGGTLAALTTQRDQASAANDAAQAALVASMQNSKLEQDQRDIKDKEHQLAILQSAYQAGVYTSSPNQTGSSSGTGQTNNSSAVDNQMARDDYRLAEVRTLDDLAQTIRKLDTTKQSLQSLLLKAQANGVGPGDAAALTIIKTQLVSLSDGLPAQLQFQLPSDSSGSTLSDLQQLQASIDQARNAAQQEFDTRRAAYEASRTQQVQQLQDQLRALRADAEALTAERNNLTLNRDLAWNSYTALARKVVERQVAEATLGQEVELAGQAASAAPAPNARLLTTVAAAAVLGFVIAMLIAFLQEGAASTERREDLVPAGGTAAAAG